MTPENMFKIVSRRSSQVQPVTVAGRVLRHDAPAFMVAEIGNNHCGDIERAEQLIRAAAMAGADAVKFQKRSPRDLLTRDGFERPYHNSGNSFGDTYGEHREALELSVSDMAALKGVAEELGLVFMASAWDLASFEEMNDLGVPAFKIASPDLTNEPLLDAAAATGRPVFLSTGMSRPEEVERSVHRFLEQDVPLILFHCVSVYPTPPEMARLETLSRFREEFGVEVGYSGHDMENAIGVAARALGACVIEKHFTLDRSWKGGDQRISLLPDEFQDLVHQVRMTEKALLGSREGLLDGEDEQRRKLAKSLVTVRPLKAGETLNAEMLTCKSPALGLSPQQLERLLGRRLNRDLPAEAYLSEHHLEQA